MQTTKHGSDRIGQALKRGTPRPLNAPKQKHKGIQGLSEPNETCQYANRGKWGIQAGGASPQVPLRDSHVRDPGILGGSFLVEVCGTINWPDCGKGDRPRSFNNHARIVVNHLQNMAASLNSGEVLFVSLQKILNSPILFGVYINAPGFWKLPYQDGR